MEIRALSRAVQILASVNAKPTGITLSEIATDVALSKATTYRFVRALLAVDFLRLELETGGYYIGPALLRFGRLAVQHEDLRMAARPFLEALRTSTGETVTLVVPVAAERLTIDVVLSEHELRAAPEVGSLKPVYAGAAGKAMLAWYPDEELKSLLNRLTLKSVAPGTITNLPALRRELVRVRERGYAISADETVLGQAASAAPVFRDAGRLVGSINISGPKVRLTRPKLERQGELVAAAAAKLSKKLGARKALPDVGRHALQR